MSLIGAAAIAGGASLLSGLVGSATSANLNKDNRNWSHDEGVYQRDWSSAEADKQRLWEEQMYNQYNSPSAMMSQYREAGINPFLNAEIGSAMSADGGVPSGSSAPSPTQFDVGHNIQSAFGSGISAMLQAQSVDAQSANQQAQGLQATVRAAVEASKYISRDAGEKILSLGMSQYGASEGDFHNATEEVRLQLESADADLRRQKVVALVAEKTGLKSAENAVMLQEQEWNKIASELGLMAIQGRVDEQRIKTLASEAAKNFSQSELFKAQKGQISELLPWLSSQLQVSVGRDALQFETEHAAYQQESKYRQWQGSEKAQDSYKYTQSMDPRNNVVTKFMKEFFGNLPVSVGVGIR